MSTLTKLKLANASRKPVEETPQERMRSRMTEHLTEQLAMATALVEGRPYAATRGGLQQVRTAIPKWTFCRIASPAARKPGLTIISPQSIFQIRAFRKIDGRRWACIWAARTIRKAIGIQRGYGLKRPQPTLR